MSVPDVFRDGTVLQAGALPRLAAPSAEAHATLGGDAGHVRQRSAIIDLDACLRDISDDAPCGPDLQYDADYVELARIMQGTPEVEYGGMHIDAADPDWKAAKVLALKLQARTRDLRLAVWLARILMGLHGYAGLDDGLALVEGCIERKWHAVHPVPDPDDDDDATERLNILASLSDDSLLRQVRLAVLVRSETHGATCLRDVDIAAGDLPPRADDEPRTPEAISAAFHAVDPSELALLADVMQAACGRLDRIESMVGEHVRHGSARVEPLSRLLRHAGKVVRAQFDMHPARPTPPASAMDRPDDTQAHGSAGQDTGERHAIENREDVAVQIDRICDYYAAAEPGSPIPLFLQRAKRLVAMNFIELMAELSPQGLAEINFLLGVRGQEQSPDADVPEAFSTFHGDISG